MTTANSSTPHDVVTAALLVIGDEILSGRTKDKNIGYIAEYLTAVGIDLMEVRVVGDEEASIVDALNALRHRYTYVFTTGGIGPTHDDITADCVAKAFGVSIDVDPRALAIMQERLVATGTEMNEARMRMTRIPKGADLVVNKVSGAPGIWLGNVIVMAGVPSIMQAMLDEVAPKLKTGIRMLSQTVRADAREGDIGTQLGQIAKANPDVAIGSYPFFDPQHGPIPTWGPRARDAQKPQRHARGGGHAVRVRARKRRLIRPRSFRAYTVRGRCGEDLGTRACPVAKPSGMDAARPQALG
jgi:molybdenum cofactor synthesis domain-containing protein